MSADGERARELTSDSQPSGSPSRGAGVRVRSTFRGNRSALSWMTGGSGKRSLFPTQLIVCIDAAASGHAVAVETSMLTPMEIKARSTLQPPMRYRLPRADGNARLACDVFANMSKFPR